MTRPRISVVDVKVKALTTKRKAAGKPKTWRCWIVITDDSLPAMLWTRDWAEKMAQARGGKALRATLTLDPPKPRQHRDRRKA